jgi:protein transport protein SEC61 subunit gamma-like protein
MGLMDRAWRAQKRLEDGVKHAGGGKYGRVLKMAKKPTSEEYSRGSTTAAIGIVIIGFIGFVIYLAATEGIPALVKWIEGFF